MKISRDRLIKIIKEELDNLTEGQSDMLNDPVFLDPENQWIKRQYQDDPEEALMNQRAAERIKEIDAEIARLQAEKESLMVNIGASQTTHSQIINRGSNE